jgi:hypothetical protein
MQTFHFNAKDPVNNLLLFDVDCLLGIQTATLININDILSSLFLVNLMLEEQSIDTLIQHIKTNLYKGMPLKVRESRIITFCFKRHS